MKILLMSTAYNSLSQRANLELQALGHETSVVLSLSAKEMLKAVDLYRPDLIVCPFLKDRVPEKIWKKHVCIIIHPGIKGDRGASSLDWAIINQEQEWGVTALQADQEMDAGAIWSTKNFKMRDGASKAGLYRIEVSNTAIDVLLEAVERFESGSFTPEELDYKKPDVHGKLQPNVKQKERAIDWAHDSTDLVMRKILAADSFPGVLDEIHGTEYYLFGAHQETELTGTPGEIIAQRTGAICRATKDGAVWVSHLKERKKNAFKLPAAQQLDLLIDDIPEVPLDLLDMGKHGTYREIWYEEQNDVGYLHFDFHNGAMSTEQCLRLRAAYLSARTRSTKVIVLMGGKEFWSNGIHLNTIEAADHSGHESWRNINAMNDLVLDIINTDTHLTISSVWGSAGAGGVILGLATDKAFARKGVIMNPHYKLMGLYGSEYWTYLLPKRVGQNKALELTENTLPVGMQEAKAIGLIDRILPNDHSEYISNLREEAEKLANSSQYFIWLAEKEQQRAADEQVKPLAEYRKEELTEMKKAFYQADSLYHLARRDFVLKVKPKQTPVYLAKHLLQKRKSFPFFNILSKKDERNNAPKSTFELLMDNG
ncbi:MAG: hydrogenase maturation protein [Methylococcales bacterium]